MERLTERKRNNDGSGVSSKSLVIEDGMRKEFPSGHCGRIVTKLADYEDLEEQGLLLRLPCKVGDTVWEIDFGRLYEYEVTGFSFGNLNEDYCEYEVIVSDQVIVYYTNSNGSITGRFTMSEIGKTVFITREEAEAALRKIKEGHDDV